MFKVIEIFRQHNALRINDAKTVEDLGLEKPDFAQRIMRGRDFKQYALQILIKSGVIHVTQDGRLYMVEDIRRGSFQKEKSNENIQRARQQI